MIKDIKTLNPEIESLDEINSIDELHNKYNFTPSDLVGNTKFENLNVFFIHGTPSPIYYKKIYKTPSVISEFINHNYPKQKVRWINTEIKGYEKLTLEEYSETIMNSIKKHISNDQNPNTGNIILTTCVGTILSYYTLRKYENELNIQAIISINGIWKGIPPFAKWKSRSILGYIVRRIVKIYESIKTFNHIQEDSELIQWIKNDLEENKNIPFDIYAIGGFTKILDYIYNSRMVRIVLGVSKSTLQKLLKSRYSDLLITADSQLMMGSSHIMRYVLKTPIIHTELIKKYIVKPFKKRENILHYMLPGPFTKILNKLDNEGTPINNEEVTIPIEYIINSYLRHT